MEVSLYISNFRIDIMKKLFTYIILVLLGVGVVDSIFSLVIEKVVPQRKLVAFQESSCDIAIFGDSRAIHHYNPLILSDSLRCSSNVFGFWGQNIYYHYATLNALLDYSKTKPKVVLLELGAIDVNNTPGWNTEKLNLLFPYFYSDSIVRELLSEVLDKEELSFVVASGLYRHNSKIIPYLRNAFEDTFIGFKPLKKEWKEPIKKSDKELGSQIDYMKVKYIEKFIELCRKENLTLIFTVSPKYVLLSKEHWKEKVKEIANNNNIRLLDHEQDKYFLDHRELFKDLLHLNEKGANIYSRIIAKEITDMRDDYDSPGPPPV